jgi:hypothetical protein
VATRFGGEVFYFLIFYGQGYFVQEKQVHVKTKMNFILEKRVSVSSLH